MRKVLFVVCFFSVLFCQSTSFGQVTAKKQSQSENLPSIIVSGLDAYKEKGPEAAVKAWIKDSPIDGSKEALSQANNLRQIEDFYGKYVTSEVIKIRQISPNSKLVYLVLNYEKGPVFAKFLVFHSSEGWILTNFVFNTRPESVLPAESGE